MLMAQGSEAAQRLVQMLAEHEEEEEEVGHGLATMEQRAAAAAPCRVPLTAGRTTVLESVSEHVASGGDRGASCSLCCDSSGIQRYADCVLIGVLGGAREREREREREGGKEGGREMVRFKCVCACVPSRGVSVRLNAVNCCIRSADERRG